MDMEDLLIVAESKFIWANRLDAHRGHSPFCACLEDPRNPAIWPIAPGQVVILRLHPMRCRNEEYRDVVDIVAELSNGELESIWSYSPEYMSGNWPRYGYSSVEFRLPGKTVDQAKEILDGTNPVGRFCDSY